MADETDSKLGRPSSYDPAFCQRAASLCAQGATDAEIAEAFDVSTRTIYRWQNEFPDFCRALKVGKDIADERVVRSLYHKAVGYTYPAVKIFMPANAKEPVYAEYQEHIPPDSTAAIFWLKNRRPDLWRDRSHLEHSGPNGGPIQTEDVNDSDRAKALAAFMAKTGAAK